MSDRLKLDRRLDTVLTGGIPDRVPCVPLVYYFAASYAKVPFRDFLTSMPAYRRAMDVCYYELGPWDAMYPLPFTMDAPEFDITWGAGVGMKPSVSAGGEGSDILQAPESETLMGEEDYSWITSLRSPLRSYPLMRFMGEMVSRYSGCPVDREFWTGLFAPDVLNLARNWTGELIRWRRRGVPMFISFSLEAPFDTFSMARGLVGFSRDLQRRGDEIREAALTLSRSMAFVAWLACVATGTNRFLLLLHRTSNDFISPVQFERFAYPSVRLIAEYLQDHGIIFGMHCDGNWDLNLEVMTDLPRGSFFQFDGTTDIFRARKILGERFTIMGDVSPNMLAFGNPSEVEEYSRSLISGVGRNGRFILSSGCEVPSNAKPENVRVMIDAARKYGLY